MQLLTRNDRRPPVPLKHNASGEIPYGRDREDLLKLIQWFHQRRMARRRAELYSEVWGMRSSHQTSASGKVAGAFLARTARNKFPI